ncbi:hypothetical protein AU476_15185 [Cupriavidus sp. UYMSc13B]|nr:hypothetical protein AU476_15185 [Cupriavidus sp. UYMSc13B]
MIDTSLRPVVVVGPARSGKTTSVPVPSLLTWRQSAVVLEVRDELFDLTEHWRRTEAQNKIRRIDFMHESSPDSYNFLDAIRRDSPHELDDIEALAASLVVPREDDEGESVDHARLLLTLCIIAKRPDVTAGLSDVFELLKQKGRDGPYATAFSYKESALSADLYQAAESLSYKFLTLSFEEATAALKVASASLTIFACPEIAENTKRSSFTITELRGDGAPVTLYLGIYPQDFLRLQPLINAFLSQLARYAVQKTPQANANRLLLALDSWVSSFGHLDFLEEPLARLSEHGVKPLIAIHSLRGEGPASRAWQQGEIRVVLPLNHHATAQLIAHEIRADVEQCSNATGTEPPLVTAEELMQMRRHEVVILGVGGSPIYAGQRAYYKDRMFEARIGAATAH